MGRLPENYIGPKERITLLKADFPKETSSIRTSIRMKAVGEALCVLVKADVYLGETLVASGHAFTDEPEEDKAVEKAETIAIGRALVNAGYPETGDDADQDAQAAEPAKPRSSGLGGAAKKPAPAEEPAKPKASGGLGAKLGAAKPKPVEQEVEESSEEQGTEAAEEALAKEEGAPPAVRKMTREELLAKYKPKKEA